jgi:flagellar biosynthesis protein FliR
MVLCAGRLLPVVFLCPLLGGHVAPPVVRLAVVLGLSAFVHLAGGIGAPPLSTPAAWVWPLVRELMLGTALGLVAAAPYDVAKLGGRIIDLVRGTSSEAALPQAGTRESATGEGLEKWLLALAATGFALPLTLRALMETFAVVPLGVGLPGAVLATEIAVLVGATMAAGLAIGAPVAACCLAVDGLLALASRVGAGVSLQDLSAPLRILGGGAVLWLGFGVVAERLLAELAQVASGMAGLVGGAP